jgi:SAM-dependent methyltransferase
MAERIIERCVVCGSRNWSITEEWKGYRLATCSECGLVFTVNPDYEAERYVAAYQQSPEEGPVPLDHRYMYAAPEKRLELEAMAFFVPPPRLTPTERLALKWLKAHAPSGAQIIDCGCGAGRFLRALNKAGFRGAGVEISETLVELLNRSGLLAVRGLASDFPWDKPAPFAITLFEVLEHIPNPLELVKTLKNRFPNTRVLASCPSPRRAVLLLHGKRGISDFPPNHFIRWTPRALENAFTKAGYTTVQVRIPAPIGSELIPGLASMLSRFIKLKPSRVSTASVGQARSSPSLQKRMAATVLIWAQKAYQTVMEILATPRAKQAAKKGASASSMLAVAE